MIDRIFKDWSYKSFFLGIITVTFALGINWEIPFSHTTLLLKNGMNVFWLICFVCGALPLSVIIMYEYYNEEKK